MEAKWVWIMLPHDCATCTKASKSIQYKLSNKTFFKLVVTQKIIFKTYGVAN